MSRSAMYAVKARVFGSGPMCVHQTANGRHQKCVPDHQIAAMVTMVLLPATLVVTLRLNGWNTTVWLTQFNLSPHISSSIHSAISRANEPNMRNYAEFCGSHNFPTLFVANAGQFLDHVCHFCGIAQICCRLRG